MCLHGTGERTGSSLRSDRDRLSIRSARKAPATRAHNTGTVGPMSGQQQKLTSYFAKIRPGAVVIAPDVPLASCCFKQLRCCRPFIQAAPIEVTPSLECLL